MIQCFFIGRDLKGNDIADLIGIIESDGIEVTDIRESSEKVGYYVEHDTKNQIYQGAIWFCAEKNGRMATIQELDDTVRLYLRKNPDSRFKENLLYTNEHHNYSCLLTRTIQLYDEVKKQHRSAFTIFYPDKPAVLPTL